MSGRDFLKPTKCWSKVNFQFVDSDPTKEDFSGGANLRWSESKVGSDLGHPSLYFAPSQKLILGVKSYDSYARSPILKLISQSCRLVDFRHKIMVHIYTILTNERRYQG